MPAKVISDSTVSVLLIIFVNHRCTLCTWYSRRGIQNMQLNWVWCNFEDILCCFPCFVHIFHSICIYMYVQYSTVCITKNLVLKYSRFDIKITCFPKTFFQSLLWREQDQDSDPHGSKFRICRIHILVKVMRILNTAIFQQYHEIV